MRTNLLTHKGYLPRSPYINALHVDWLTLNNLLRNFKCNLSISLDLVYPHISAPLLAVDPTKASNN